MTTLLHSDSLSAEGGSVISATGACTSLGSLIVEPWPDPVVDGVGYDPRSRYAEQYWLPVLGPSTTWMLRRFAAFLEEAPGAVEIDAEELARSLGIGERLGPNSPFARTLKRCVDFEMAEWHLTTLAVRRKLPPLARRHLRRLPDALREQHEREAVEALRRGGVHERLRAQGRELALSLVSYGDDRSSAEQQLVRWGFELPVAAECAEWAAAEARQRRLSGGLGD
jgi:hypothetical protein